MFKYFIKLNILIVCFLFLFPLSVSADIKYKAAIPISKTFAKEITVDGKTLGVYVEDVYKYSLGVIGILATIVMMWGGIRWITAGGSADSIGEAKAWIMASISGIVIALSSFSILYFINPDLVKFREVVLPEVSGTRSKVSGKGCCNNEGVISIKASEDACYGKDGKNPDIHFNATYVKSPNGKKCEPDKVGCCVQNCSEMKFSADGGFRNCSCSSSSLKVPCEESGSLFYADAGSCKENYGMYYCGYRSESGPCGNDPRGSTCMTPMIYSAGFVCPSGYERDRYGGADCIGDLLCCVK